MGNYRGIAFGKVEAALTLNPEGLEGDGQGKNNLRRETYKWKDPNGLQELQEARISEQDEQTDAVIRGDWKIRQGVDYVGPCRSWKEADILF